jgi:hypothetical protein
MSSDDKDLLMQYQFRLSSGIERVDKVVVKFTAGKLPDPDNPGMMMEIDGKTTIYQRTPPEKEGGPDDWPGVYPKWKPGLEVEGEEPPGDLESFRHEGIITLRWDIAKQGGNRKNGTNEIFVDGVFWGGRIKREKDDVPPYPRWRLPFDGSLLRPHFPSYSIEPIVEAAYAATSFEELKIEAEGGLEIVVKHVRDKSFQITAVKYPDV